MDILGRIKCMMGKHKWKIYSRWRRGIGKLPVYRLFKTWVCQRPGCEATDMKLVSTLGRVEWFKKRETVPIAPAVEQEKPAETV